MTDTAARAAEGDGLTGGALDAAIAAQVFGGPAQHPEWYWWPDTAGVAPPLAFCGPHFSTQIEAAWLVVERLREIGLQLAIATEGDGWEVEVCTTKALSRQGSAGCYHADRSLPLAICAAALRSCAPLAARAEGEVA